ncbi:MAG: thioredoxin family protein [Pauljensenia sp.]
MTLAILVGLVLVGVLIGTLFRAQQGRSRRADGPAGDLVDPEARVTVIQLSTPMCARCPGTARLARTVVDLRPGARHREIDLVDHPDIADRFHVASTPTLLLVDGSGRVRRRIVGAPSRVDLTHAIDELLEVPA